MLSPSPHKRRPVEGGLWGPPFINRAEASGSMRDPDQFAAARNGRMAKLCTRLLMSNIDPVRSNSGPHHASLLDYYIQLLSDSAVLREMYALRREAFPQSLLADKHFQQQHELVDRIAQRVRLMGGEVPETPAVLASSSLIARQCPAWETPSQRTARFLAAHQTVILVCRALVPSAARLGDDADTMLVVAVIRTHEAQSLALFLQGALHAGPSSSSARF